MRVRVKGRVPLVALLADSDECRMTRERVFSSALVDSPAKCSAGDERPTTCTTKSSWCCSSSCRPAVGGQPLPGHTTTWKLAERALVSAVRIQLRRGPARRSGIDHVEETMACAETTECALEVVGLWACTRSSPLTPSGAQQTSLLMLTLRTMQVCSAKMVLV